MQKHTDSRNRAAFDCEYNRDRATHVAPLELY